MMSEVERGIADLLALYEKTHAENARLRAALVDMAECDTWPVFSHRVVIEKAREALASREGKTDG